MSDTMSDTVNIIDVGPRDGLQNELKPIEIADKISLIARLRHSGCRIIEAGAFVSPKAIPQMAGSAEILQGLQHEPGISYPVLVPNEQGMIAAIAAGAREVAIFTAASESFTLKNIRCSIDESFARFAPVMDLARAHNIRVRGYVSCIAGCPYEGAVPVAKVINVTEKLLALGVYQVSLGDTIGVGTFAQIQALLKTLLPSVPASLLAGHFHDTYGQALGNVLASLELGLRSFDSSVGGLGGCPYAPGASGNLATEDLVYLLDGMGMNTGIDIVKLSETGAWISNLLGKPYGSKAGMAIQAKRIR